MFSHVYEQCSRLLEQSNRVGIEFLVADLNTGLTFLKIAHGTSPPENSCSFEKARKVYRTVTRLLPRVRLSPGERWKIERGLEDLRSQLEQAGYSCAGT